MVHQVMVVDDDAGVIFTVKTILEEYDIAVRTAVGGNECLAALREGFKGLILLDIMMPEMDGWQTIRNMMKEEHTERSIICMLTAKHMPDPEMDELKQYVLEYIRKPFSSEHLITVVKEYLPYLEH